MLEEPPEGKTIFLLSSKRSIEMMFIKFMEKMEAKGVTMLCQGMSGGQGRMEAEFLSAQGKTVWLLTPWTYEGTDLPRGSVDHLVLESLPFDHPNHAVLSRRALHFKNAFMQYFVPRLQHRLFRLLRTFRRHARDGGDVCVLDQRLFSKDYGRAVRGYLSRFAAEEKTDCGPEPKDTPEPKKQPTKKNATPKKDEGQLQLF